VKLSTGEIVTAVVAALVAIGAIAMVVDARRKRRAAKPAQTHSNVKPQSMHDQATLIREGGTGQSGQSGLTF
jgi:hypothetical protein